MSSLYDKQVNKSINFLEQHIGGNNDDTQSEFINQKNIIAINDKKINLNEIRTGNKDEEDGGGGGNGIGIGGGGSGGGGIGGGNGGGGIGGNGGGGQYNLLNNEFIYSNARIVPPTIDLQFKYIKDKNLSNVNDQIVTQIDYINIDSAQRLVNSDYIIDFYKKLEPNSLIFIDGSNELTIKIDNTGDNVIEVDNLITLDGVMHIKKIYSNVNIQFINNSNIVTLGINKNYNYLNDSLGVYISLKILNYDSLSYQNIPISILNNVYKIIINPEYPDSLSFLMPITFYTNNITNTFFVSDVEIEYFNVGNYPINLINANSPISNFNVIEYHRVVKVSSSTITITLSDNISIIDNTILQFNENIQIGKIINVVQASPTASDFIVNLTKIYKNVLSVEMISSEIPIINVNTSTINNSNNLLYWKNLFDNDYIYSITIPIGQYEFNDLIKTIETEILKVRRVGGGGGVGGGVGGGGGGGGVGGDYSIKQYEYNIIKVNTNPSINISTFNSYNKYILANCFINADNGDISRGIVVITIKQTNHNLTTGERIFINNALDYDYVPASYFNTIEGHIVNVLSVDIYTITITNVNQLTIQAEGNGGYNIEIITNNSFQLLFNFENTCGNIFGFSYVGLNVAITPYSSFTNNNFTITNTDPYILNPTNATDTTNTTNITNISNTTNPTNVNNTNKKVSLSNQRYILLKSNDVLNTCNTIGGTTFFYKFNLEPCYGTDILYNRHVKTTHYFNPPLYKLDYLQLQLVDANDNIINMYNLNYSFTLKIISISNYPENTNINPNVAKT
jgi:hypothetical protein